MDSFYLHEYTSTERQGADQTPMFGLPLHLLRRISVARVLVSATRPGVASALEISSGLRGPSPRLLPPYEGLGLLPGAWGAPNKGNDDGAKGIFGNAEHV